jgi:exodeoxyribonuclease V alpha subunit
VRAVPAARLPAHETAYCTTVHKAQGSEYARVAFVLPIEAGGILSRELIYTAVTRATTAVRIIGSRALLYAGVARKTQRNSGLADRIEVAAR